MKLLLKIGLVGTFLVIMSVFSSCKKDKLITDSGARVSLSQDSVLFDTVFTTLGSATRNIRIRNKNSQPIKITSLRLLGGTGSSFILNLDGAKGVAFSDVEIAANDSIYMFIQVNVDPNNANSPLIVEDKVELEVNGNKQVLELQAWGQDAYYHRPTNAIKFADGSYLPYSLISSNPNADTTWKKGKPHVIFGYLVVDSAQKLTIEAGVRVFMNFKAGLWVYRKGQIRILGKKGDEVTFQGARREKEYADEAGQWDRIWINEGSNLNRIDYAIIKNSFIGVQAERLKKEIDLEEPGRLTITNTKIQNARKWGMSCRAYSVTAGNLVVSNCQEFCLNVEFGGDYRFLHCTFANYWNKDKSRDVPAVNVNNYIETSILPIKTYFGNCIIDGSRDSELNFDIKQDATFTPTTVVNNSWVKTNSAVTNTVIYTNVITTPEIKYRDVVTYDFQPKSGQSHLKFNSASARSDGSLYKTDINGTQRPVSVDNGVNIGAYEPE